MPIFVLSVSLYKHQDMKNATQESKSMPVSEVSNRESVMVTPLVSFVSPSADSIAFFTFKEGDKVVWMAPKTRSMYATFVSTEVKADGKEWSIIHVAGTGRILVMASDLTPAW